MNSDLISIIIPVYKAEKYLERCVESVLRQTYTNTEIILVDDGSPDSSGEICEQLAEIDNRVFVFHKENEGAASARNFGVKQSKGNYIVFVDSDDYIAEDYIEYLSSMVHRFDTEIACCGMTKTNSDKADFSNNLLLPNVRIISGKDACIQLFGELYLILVVPWGKIIKREIALEYPFPTGRKDEDEATTAKWLYSAKQVAIGNRCLYAYYQNPSSLTHTKGKSQHLDAIWALEHRAHFFEEKQEKQLAKIAWQKVFFYCMKDSLKNEGRCDEYLNNNVCLKRLTIRMLIHWILYRISPTLYKSLKKID